MYTYNREDFLKHINELLRIYLSREAWVWLTEKSEQTAAGNSAALFTSFTSAPRNTSKALIMYDSTYQEKISSIVPGFTLSGYTADRLARISLLLNWPAADKETYLKTIKQLFRAAEMNELVALYGALPLLAYPEDWVEQCREGIRSNIGSVLEAIICDNPYPAEYLPEPAWNQLVLKAFFTDKAIDRIQGLDQRSNRALADTLSDYAHERWAAHRSFDPQLWRVVSGFIDERIYPDIQKVFQEGNEHEKEAAALACAQSDYPAARTLLDTVPLLKSAIERNELNWKSLAEAVQADADEP
jgi:hypothetical protein